MATIALTARAVGGMRIAAVRMAVIALVVGILSGTASAQPDPSRFFVSGDGHLRLEHAHFGTRIDVRFRDANGVYSAEALASLRTFFRSRDSNREGPLSLRLVELLDYVEDRFQPSRIVVYSAYRSPELNASLAGTARTSLHTQGLAIDVGLEGVDLRPAWDRLRAMRFGGVGYYAAGGFLHLDGGAARFWEASTSRVGEDLSAGNARVFARTEFDRYATLDDIEVTLHSVTATPLGLRVQVSPGLRLVPISPGIVERDGCLWIETFDDEYRFTLEADSAAARHADLSGRSVRLDLSTCSPRVDRTPESIAANAIEIVRSEAVPASAR